MRAIPVFATLALMFTFAAPVQAEHGAPLTVSCENPEWAYSLNFPEGWHFNQRTEGPGGPVQACRYFSPEPVEVQPGTEPSDISIGIDRDTGLAYDEFGGEPVTVGGRNARRLETEDQMTGGLHYMYRIEMPEWGAEDSMVARTLEGWIGDYEENKQILDAMMESLVFATQEATPTPLPDVAASQPDTVTPGLLGTHDPQHGEECTAEGISEAFACGEILVKPNDPDQIDEIVARHGGDPESDILDELIDGTWFLIAVEVGAEPESVETFADDPDVAEAELNALAGTADPTPTPTAVPDAAASPATAGTTGAALVAGLLALVVLTSTIVVVAALRR